MNFKGKYTIIRKDKNGNILQKKSKYNKITTKGRNIVLNLFKNATSDGNFKQLIGYKPLDLSDYKLTPLLRNPSYNKEDSNSKEYVESVLHKETLTGYDADYETYFQFENENQQKWNVKSSFFFQKSVYHDGVTYEYQNKNKTASVTDSYYSSDNYSIVLKTDYNGNRRSNVDYSQYDYQLTNNGNNSKSSVDQILFYNNQIDFTWSGCKTDNASFLTRNIHNIDFFLVKCKQKIRSRKKGVKIPLWNGMSEQLYDSNVVLTQPKVKFRHSFSHWDDYNKEYYQKPNIIVLWRKYKSDNPNQWQELGDSDFDVDESKMTIEFNSGNSNFSDGSDSNNADQFMVFYNVYYLDDQLKNGICGMYLNYSLTKDNQKRYSEQVAPIEYDQSGQIINRMMFGNGVFSYDGFKTLDDRLSFPWQGRPIKIQKTHQSSSLKESQYFYNNNFNGKYPQNSPTHKLNITSQYNDYVPQRFYSFYPYVTNSPTNFVFMLCLYDNIISIKNFVFLVPQLRTTTPRVFIFGAQQTQPTNEQEITKEIFRLDAIQCDSESTKNVEGNQVSLITWKTYVDYQVGNNQVIKQLGLACGTDKLQETSYGWRYIKPITKDQCDQLFSKITLQEAVSKTDEQALEVIYELVVQ